MLLGVLAASPAQALAQSARPDPAIEISIATKGMSKGVAQTDDIQIVARGEIGLGPAFVLGAAKNLAPSVAKAELQLGVGARFRIAGLNTTAAATYKTWTGARGNPDSTAAEFSLAATWGLSKVAPRIHLVLSPDDLGSTEESLYLEAGIGWKISESLQLSANVGRRERTKGLDYTAGNIGIAYSVKQQLVAEMRLYATDKSSSGGENFEPRAVASLRAKF